MMPCRQRVAARQAELAVQRQSSKAQLLREQTDELAAKRARVAAQRTQQLVRQHCFLVTPLHHASQ